MNKRTNIFCFQSMLLMLILMTSHGMLAQKFENLAMQPPMGWNSWNSFECEGLNEQVIKEVADAMEHNGMKAVGYEYIVIDDCWQIGRDTAGRIQIDKEKFPSGIKSLVDYVHSKGLKFGIYSDAGVSTCAGRPGSKGYELIDAKTYAEWGVDFLKYDWCNTEGQEAIASYTIMRDALYQAGNPIVFSLCEWGTSKPWEWAKEVGHLWRTTLDIDLGARFDGDIWGNQLGWTDILDKQVGLEKYAGPGHWNDPDMLTVGNHQMPENEARAHFTMWCMLAAPLIAGNDIRTMTKETQAILTHQKMIAVNQDVLGKQGFKIVDKGHFEVWQKPLSGNEIAICFLNRDTKDLEMNVDWESLPIKGFNGSYKLHNLWVDNKEGKSTEKLRIYIPARDVVVFKLQPIN